MLVPTPESQAPPRASDPGKLETLRTVFQKAGFVEDRVADLLGATEFLTRYSREFGRAIHRTKAETPLHVLTRLFLLGVPVSADAVRRARDALARRTLDVVYSNPRSAKLVVFSPETTK